MIREIAIADCVHYCGFRYGRDEFNPYENYIVGLASGMPLNEIQQQFIDFIRHYRPRDLGEALGVVTNRSIPLWLLPWKSWRKLFRPGGWQTSPIDVVDILTHFSPQGVEWHRIEGEFGWLENAFFSIRDHSYLPEQFGYIEVFELRAAKESRFLVMDGNHRLSALHALGEKQVRVRQRPLFRAQRRFARFWPLVLSGHVSHRDAVAVFDAYFDGNKTPHRTHQPASILY